MPYEHELAVAIEAVQKASQLTSSVQFNLIDEDTVKKKDRSPVTIADFGSQAVISSILDAALDDPLVGEEDIKELQQNDDLRQRVVELVQGVCPDMTEAKVLDAIARGNAEPDYTDRYWTVDPIDGTKGFLRKEQYAVALALVENGQVQVGVLGCPNLPHDFDNPDQETGVLLAAVRGEGAFQASMDGANRQTIRVNSLSDASQARFVESVEAAHSAHSVHQAISDALGITRPSLRIDSQCKYATVGRGDVAIYLRYPKDDVYREKIWDHAAGVIVVEEAGGRVTDILGQPLDFSQGRKLVSNRGVVATSGVFHDKIIETIQTLRGDHV